MNRLVLSTHEVGMLASALRATLAELEACEFHTRVGFDRTAAEVLLEDLGARRSSDDAAHELDDEASSLAFFVLNEVVNGFEAPAGALVGDQSEREALMDKLRPQR